MVKIFHKNATIWTVKSISLWNFLDVTLFWLEKFEMFCGQRRSGFQNLGFVCKGHPLSVENFQVNILSAFNLSNLYGRGVEGVCGCDYVSQHWILIFNFSTFYVTSVIWIIDISAEHAEWMRRNSWKCTSEFKKLLRSSKVH